MPELPEVEVVRRGVERWATRRTIQRVTVHDVRSLRRHAPGPEAFEAQLTGATLQTPQRRGKFLWIPLAPPVFPATPSDTRTTSAPGAESTALMIHLGMSGQVLIEAADAPPEKHLKVTLDLSSEHDDAGQALPSQLRFVDQRIFGGMQLSALVEGPDGRAVPAAAGHIAPDPLEDLVSGEWFFRTLRRRRSGLKRSLLDQTVISGVGNIYADEALWMSRLHYARRTETVTRAQAARLLEALRTVMFAALEAGGTSFDALYVNVNGASGYFDRSLNAYGQAGQPCRRCHSGVISREKFMGRSSYWCPVCQPRPRTGRW